MQGFHGTTATVVSVTESDSSIDSMNPRQDAGTLVLAALRSSMLAAETALASNSQLASNRRESVRTARRELKSVRALAPLCRAPQHGAFVDGVLEFSAKANQLLGPLRDRDALIRSITRISDRFVDGEPRRVVRTVLLATLVFAETDRRDDSQFADSAIARARRAMRAAMESVTRLDAEAPIDRRAVESMMRRTFESCRVELREALEVSDLARLHECRKKASFLALTLRPFESGLSPSLRRVRNRAKRLATTLGEDRDLALLDVELNRARAQLAGSPLVESIDAALRLARLEASVRMEDSARAFLRLGRRGVFHGLAELFDS